MADQTGPNHQRRLKYAIDAGFLSGAHPPDSDTPHTSRCTSGDSGSDSVAQPSSDSDDESTGLADLAASFRFFSESLLRVELAEKEMARAREASRIEAEKRRMESEGQLTQMLMQTQVQIAALVKGPARKRKRAEQDDPRTSDREGALLLSLLLHSNSMW